jgi:hypothetical protein
MSRHKQQQQLMVGLSSQGSENKIQIGCIYRSLINSSFPTKAASAAVISLTNGGVFRPAHRKLSAGLN